MASFSEEPGFSGEPGTPDAPSLRELSDALVVVAFGGWNDAGSAATEAVSHLIEVSNAEVAYTLDSEDFYDFQVNRPTVLLPGPGERTISWPATQLLVGHVDGRDLVIVTGPEPNLRWRTYANRLVSALRSVDVSLVMVLGALMADVPHTRPIAVSRTAISPATAHRYGVQAPEYEGPTGIVGVFSDYCVRANFEVVSLWATVPHYVAAPPNPKGAMSLLQRIEDLAEIAIDLDDLPELAKAWERGVAELIEEDTELAEYVATLESESDEAELPEASGDAIAEEFQRYLRRRGK
ncbi:MAG: PAC2 family protein [Propionibacteriales bacterium]|nr:PAC2 family protein [Propionibacteriales bacterium]